MADAGRSNAGLQPLFCQVGVFAICDPVPYVSGMAGMYRIEDLLNLLVHEGGEELRLEPGRPAVMVLHGSTRVVEGTLLTSENIRELFHSIASEEQRRELDLCGEIHCSYSGQNSVRFRVSAREQDGKLSLTAKNISRS
jgi:twitching motility protein PilT